MTLGHSSHCIRKWGLGFYGQGNKIPISGLRNVPQPLAWKYDRQHPGSGVTLSPFCVNTEDGSHLPRACCLLGTWAKPSPITHHRCSSWLRLYHETEMQRVPRTFLLSPLRSPGPLQQTWRTGLRDAGGTCYPQQAQEAAGLSSSQRGRCGRRREFNITVYLVISKFADLY